MKQRWRGLPHTSWFLSMTKAWGNLPDFIIVGAQKSGTSALCHNLHRHPDVHMASYGRYVTECQFFNEKWDLGLDWYRQWFRSYKKLKGEKSPDYLSDLFCHERMAQTVPNAKLIISLRNPVDRAYSAWNHFNQDAAKSKHSNWEVKPFHEAIAGLDASNRSARGLLKKGYYIDQIHHLLKFYPRDQIYFVIAERLRADPEQEFAKLLEFLGAGSATRPFENFHEREYPEPMDPKLRSKLMEQFAPSVAQLSDFLSDPLPEWH